MRRSALLFAAGFLALAGCMPPRTSRYAPRMDNTDFHREAVEKRNCADCHDPAVIRHHALQDDCTSCHIVCGGC